MPMARTHGWPPHYLHERANTALSDLDRAITAYALCRTEETPFINLPPKYAGLGEESAVASTSKMHGLGCNLRRTVQPSEEKRAQELLRNHRLVHQAIRREVRSP